MQQEELRSRTVAYVTLPTQWQPRPLIHLGVAKLDDGTFVVVMVEVASKGVYIDHCQWSRDVVMAMLDASGVTPPARFFD